MSKLEKKLEKMRQNPRGWRYEEVAGILRRHGFNTDSEGGSHRVFRHPATGERVTLVEKGSGTLLPAYVQDAVAAIDRVKAATT